MNLYLQNIGVCQDFRGAGLYAQDEIDAVSRIYGNGVLAGREKACQKLISGKLACDVLGCSVGKIECDGVCAESIEVYTGTGKRIFKNGAFIYSAVFACGSRDITDRRYACIIKIGRIQ